MIRASDGEELWSTHVPGVPESVAAFDLDGDGALEILVMAEVERSLRVGARDGDLADALEAAAQPFPKGRFDGGGSHGRKGFQAASKSLTWSRMTSARAGSVPMELA